MPVSVRRVLAGLLTGLFLAVGCAVVGAVPATAAPPVSGSAGSAVSAAADPAMALAARRAKRGATKVIVIGAGALLVALIVAAVNGRRGRNEDREQR